MSECLSNILTKIGLADLLHFGYWLGPGDPSVAKAYPASQLGQWSAGSDISIDNIELISRAIGLSQVKESRTCG